MREEGAYCIRTFFVGPKGRSLKEMLALGKSIQNSLAAGEQEAYRDGAPNAKKPTRTTLHFGAARAHRGQVLYLTHGLEGLHVNFFLHKNKMLRPDSDVAGVLVRRPKKREHGTVRCFLLLTYEAYRTSLAPQVCDTFWIYSGSSSVQKNKRNLSSIVLRTR